MLPLGCRTFYIIKCLKDLPCTIQLVWETQLSLCWCLGCGTFASLKKASLLSTGRLATVIWRLVNQTKRLLGRFHRCFYTFWYTRKANRKCFISERILTEARSFPESCWNSPLQCWMLEASSVDTVFVVWAWALELGDTLDRSIEAKRGMRLAYSHSSPVPISHLVFLLSPEKLLDWYLHMFLPLPSPIGGPWSWSWS